MKTTLAGLAHDGVLSYGDGYRTRKDELADSGFRIIRVADVTDGRVRMESPDFVSVDRASAIGPKQAQGGDILLTTKGTVGRVAVMPETAEEAVYSPQLCFFRTKDQETLDRGWLKSWFGSHEFLRQAGECMGKTDMAAYINLRDLGMMTITVPAHRDQRAIAEVLSALDDAIAVQENILGTVRALEDAVYLRASASEGQMRQVGELVRFLNRRRVPLSSRERADRPGRVPYYGAAGRIDHVDEPLFDEPLILVGEDGTVETHHGTAVVQYIWGPSWVNNHAHVLVGDGVSTDVLRVALRSLVVSDAITGAVQPKLSMARLGALFLKVPAKDEISRLSEVYECLGAVIRASSIQRSRLAGLRDVLLPELMSGRMRVKDAQQRVEEAI